jgi:DNA-binding HxlR family transcriptional regulator
LDILTVAVTASAVVATTSFVYSVVTRRRVERATELRHWQRVVIYTLVEECSPVTFDELKARYLRRAKDMLSRRVPNKVIQDDSLKRILLDLQSEGLVVRRADLAYQLQVKLPPDPRH